MRMEVEERGRREENRYVQKRERWLIITQFIILVSNMSTIQLQYLYEMEKKKLIGCICEAATSKCLLFFTQQLKLLKLKLIFS